MKVREYIMLKNEFNHPVLHEKYCYDWSGDSVPLDENYRMMKEIFYMDKLITESSYVIAFDHAQQLKGVCETGRGNANEVMTSMQNIFTFLLLTGATSFFVVHNHISNMPDPSPEDQIMTMTMGDLAYMFDIEFIGHMVISPEGYVMDGGTMDGSTSFGDRDSDDKDVEDIELNNETEDAMDNDICQQLRQAQQIGKRLMKRLEILEKKNIC